MQTNGNHEFRPIQIAPAPSARQASSVTKQDAPASEMPYSCQECGRRKVKCDRAAPACIRCQKSQVECIYKAPPSRQHRKRRLSNDSVDPKLAQYEHILAQHGLLPQSEKVSEETTVQKGAEAAASATTAASTSRYGSQDVPVPSPAFSDLDKDTKGRLVNKHGKSRYLNSNLWHAFGDEDMQGLSEDDDENQNPAVAISADILSMDPLSAALISPQKSLLRYHPTHLEAMILWKTHVDRVEPLCKVLHIPTMSRTVELLSQQPDTASKTDECLLFAIYHFAVFSMTEAECVATFGHPRATLLQKYHSTIHQALVNASWLKTTEIKIVQALLLLLIPCRNSYDPQTYWILTGVMVRIAQRMGLHLNDEKLSLPPFEIQLRRRLFYQIIAVDGISGQLSGTGISIMHDSWDVPLPLNINDDQIWPEMTEPPQGQTGATEMIFCLMRASMVKYFSKAGMFPLHGTFKDFDVMESVITEAEREVEENYIRYCDVINPLHFLAAGFARSGITASRLRSRLSRAKTGATDAERRELFQLSLKILDTDCAAFAHSALQKFLWHVNAFFAAGTWDSLILILTTLQKRNDLLSHQEIEEAWSRLEQIYDNHSNVMYSKRTLYTTLGRMTFKAWEVTHPPNMNSTDNMLEPNFITTLRASAIAKPSKHLAVPDANSTTALSSGWDSSNNTCTGITPSSMDDDALFASLAGDMSFNMSNDFMNNNYTANWMFWDHSFDIDEAQGL